MFTESSKSRAITPRPQNRISVIKEEEIVDKSGAPSLKVVPLGGLEEIGRNMAVFEYEDEIIIVDMGLQFPEEDMHGIDYIIPNISYLQGKEHLIKGVFITHGHYDHIGAIPHLISQLNYPPIYCTNFSRGIIMRRQEDYKDRNLKVNVIKKEDKVEFNHFKIEFFHVNHNIPDGVGIVIDTPVGRVVHTGDFKFDHSPVGDYPADVSRIAQIGAGGVLLLLSDSTSADTPGYTISEREVQNNLETIFKSAEARIIIATFSSLITRIQAIVNLAEKYDRKIVVEGYSMRMNIEIAKEMGFLKIGRYTIVKSTQADALAPSKVVVLCTGAQGEGNAVLMRIANREHKSIQIQKGDSIVFSSSVIPGNERTIQGLKDNLYRQGAKIFHSQLLDIHASGHGQAEDLKMMINLTRPKFMMPIHGTYYMRSIHGELAQTVGIDEKNIIKPSNGHIVSIYANKYLMSKKRVPTNYIMVDGLGVGDVGAVVLRDRQMMAKDGMFVVIATVDSQTGKVKASPDIISRGFIYMRGSKELLYATRLKVKEIIESADKSSQPINWAYVKDNLRDKIGLYLYQKTNRRPMVLPVIIEV